MDALQQSDLKQLRHERNAALYENHILKALNEDLLKRNKQLSKELAALKSILIPSKQG